MSLTKLLADLTGHGAEYDLLTKFRALPPNLQDEIVQFGKQTYERWSGGLLPPGPMGEQELYRLYRQLPAPEAAKVRRKGLRVYAAWKRGSAGKPDSNV